ncbi:MAG: hypothetical protein ACT4PT_05930 [Methanobacteriota archaeon]
MDEPRAPGLDRWSMSFQAAAPPSAAEGPVLETDALEVLRAAAQPLTAAIIEAAILRTACPTEISAFAAEHARRLESELLEVRDTLHCLATILRLHGR